jgi:N6-L-threonylcarbamoyladenine synthase
MLILGLETSCDETAAALVRDGRLPLASVVASQEAVHAPYWGVVPELASRAHEEKLLPVVRECLVRAGVGLGSVDAVAVGHRPGLIGSLLVGLSAAKALAWSLGRPIVGVDHVHAHLVSGMLPAPGADTVPDAEPVFPALGLVVSGGHTSMYLMRSWVELERLGGTIDDAAGEAFDKAATMLGLPFPGGPALDRLASRPGADERSADLPVSRLGPGSLDFSFSGLKTAMLYAVRGVPGPGGVFERDASDLDEARRADLAAAFQRAVCEAIVLKLNRALDGLAGQAGGAPRTLLTGGGVTANSRLRCALEDLARRRGLDLRLPRREYCGDNAAMIAALAFHRLRAGPPDSLALRAEPTTAR